MVDGKRNSAAEKQIDGIIIMLELAGETTLAQEFTVLQQQFVFFMRGTRREALQKTLSLDRLHDLTERYAHLIERQISSKPPT